MKKREQEITNLKKELIKVTQITASLSENEILYNNSDQIRNSFDFLDKLASQQVSDHIIEYLLNDNELKPILEEICRFRKIFNIKMELERAELILKSNQPWEAIRNFKFYKNYIQLADMEVRGANLESDQRVVFLGSGPLPLSLIVLCNNYQLKGVGIEQKTEYAKISQKVIDKLNLNDRIKVINGNHFSLSSDMKTYLIMIAAAAVPKDEIFGNLRTNINPGTNISYRIYEHGFRKLLDVDSRALFYKKEKQFSYLNQYRKIYPIPPVNNTCVFGKI